MKIKYKRFMAIIFFVVMIVRISNADLIIGDAVLGVNPFDPTGYQLALSQSTEGGGLFAIFISDNGGGSYNFSYAGIAEEYGLYTAFLGMEFVPAYAASHTPIVSNNGIDPGSSLQSFALNQTKYFAYWDDRPGSLGSGPDRADNYGWVSLTYTGSELTISDGATAIGDGIIVGTYTQVPEPATILLFGLGGLGAWLLRRNKARCALE